MGENQEMCNIFLLFYYSCWARNEMEEVLHNWEPLLLLRNPSFFQELMNISISACRTAEMKKLHTEETLPKEKFGAIKKLH